MADFGMSFIRIKDWTNEGIKKHQLFIDFRNWVEKWDRKDGGQ